MKKPPCIRGIVKRCPEKTWDGQDGCPAWIERNTLTKGGEQQIVKQCLDLWVFKMLWDQCGLLEGNQQAVESFRNGMCQEFNGEVMPKPDPVMVALFNEQQKKLIQ